MLHDVSMVEGEVPPHPGHQSCQKKKNGTLQALADSTGATGLVMTNEMSHAGHD